MGSDKTAYKFLDCYSDILVTDFLTLEMVTNFPGAKAANSENIYDAYVHDLILSYDTMGDYLYEICDACEFYEEIISNCKLRFLQDYYSVCGKDYRETFSKKKWEKRLRKEARVEFARDLRDKVKRFELVMYEDDQGSGRYNEVFSPAYSSTFIYNIGGCVSYRERAIVSRLTDALYIHREGLTHAGDEEIEFLLKLNTAPFFSRRLPEILKEMRRYYAKAGEIRDSINSH